MFRRTSHSLPASVFQSYYWNTSLCVSKNEGIFFLLHSSHMNKYQHQAATAACLPCCWSLVAMLALPVDVREGRPPSSVSWWWDDSVVLWVSFSMQCFCPSFNNDLTYWDLMSDSDLHSPLETLEAGETLPRCTVPQRRHSEHCRKVAMKNTPQLVPLPTRQSSRCQQIWTGI